MFSSDQKRTFLAVIISGLILFGWQYYFAPKPDVSLNTKNANAVNLEKSPVTPSVLSSPNNSNSPVHATNTTNTTNSDNPSLAAVPDQVIELKNSDHSFKFSNNLVFLGSTNTNSVFPFSDFSENGEPLKLTLLNEFGPILPKFSFQQISDSEARGVSEQFGIQIHFTLDQDGRLKFHFQSANPFKYRFTFQSSEKKLDNGQIRQYMFYNQSKVNFQAVGSDKEGDGSLKWFGLDFNYHIFSVVLKDAPPARYKMTDSGLFHVDPSATQKSFEGYLLFSKKTYDHLEKLGDQLHLSVDFGFFAILAVPMLHSLQWLYKFIPNYGVAIILLTILIRLITFPLQWKSFKSMKKMQVIQPELQKIREKFKDEPQKLQAETMNLFKKSGANPLSGCLPLLLQMPFFFAIYKVLYSSVELVGAPFLGWILDLSVKDPFYVLPLLMTISMFLQQKLTPQTTMDPMQQKVMLIMPIVFGFIMHSLPAGLVLYIFISTAFGIIQQMFVYKLSND